MGFMDYINRFTLWISGFFNQGGFVESKFFHFLILLTCYVFLSLFAKYTLIFFEKKSEKIVFISIRKQIFILARKMAFHTLTLIFTLINLHLFHLKFLDQFVFGFYIVLIAFPVKDLVYILLEYLEERWAKNSETKIDDIIFDLLNKFAGSLIIIFAVIMALDIFGINVMPFIAGAGIAGIAIGFAAKDTLSNLIAGILLIVDRPFEIGDRIEVWNSPKNSASWGDVVDIGLRATKIKTTDNIVIIIPNNEIMKRDIINYTIISQKIRVRINIGISYEANVTKAKEVMIKIAKQVDWVSETPPPVVVVNNFGESSVDLQLRVWINDARKRIHTISYIIDNVKEAFDVEGIEIPYPKRDITIVNK